MSGQCQFSGVPPIGMTLHSAGRVRPASLPHQRTSGPLMAITASGASVRISSYHWSWVYCWSPLRFGWAPSNQTSCTGPYSVRSSKSWFMKYSL